jgi:hypothetical protein
MPVYPHHRLGGHEDVDHRLLGGLNHRLVVRVQQAPGDEPQARVPGRPGAGEPTGEPVVIGVEKARKMSPEKCDLELDQPAALDVARRSSSDAT